MNRKQKILKIIELINELPEIDLSKWSTEDLISHYYLSRRVEDGELKKTDPEFINVIKKMETKYRCKIDHRKY